MSEKKKSKGNPILALIFIGIVVFVFVKVNPTDISDWMANQQTKENTATFNLKTSYPDFYKWITTVDTKDINFTRHASIESVCGVYKDVDGDGDKDFYTDKSCMQENYKEYLKPDAFNTGTSQDMGKDTCGEEDLNRYSYICSRFGDMLTRIKYAKSGVDTDKNYSDAEAIYNEIAVTNN